MTDTEPFALIVLLAAAVVLVAVLSNRLTERVKVPSPALVLAGAAIAVQIIPALHAPPRPVVERVVTVALVFILFDGGMHIGWSRFRSAVGPIATVGVIGTFATVATECAQVAGLSPSACSYHLRTLARYGFVEEDRASRGRARAPVAGPRGRLDARR